MVQANPFTFEYPPPDYNPVEVLIPTLFRFGIHPNNLEIDTHLLFAKADGVFIGQESETNDNAYGDNFGMHRGLGTCDMNGEIDLDSPIPAGGAFMQVVFPAGNGCIWNFAMSGTLDGVPFKIGPEPSTIMMLIASGLCLLAARFRKLPWARK